MLLRYRGRREMKIEELRGDRREEGKEKESEGEG
jgi:hypothetical protein